MMVCLIEFSNKYRIDNMIVLEKASGHNTLHYQLAPYKDPEFFSPG